MDPGRTPDVHSLVGAYVLDAVSDAERAAFEHHLDKCAACTQEVAELRQAATRLGQAAWVEPPARLKSAVLARILRVRQRSPGEASVTELRRFTRVRLSSAAAVVLLVATTVLGVFLVRDRQALEETQLRADSVISILRAGDTQVTGVTDAGAGRMTVVVSRSRDRLILLADGLAEAPSGHDYQVWKMREDAVESAGFLRPEGGRTTLDVSGIGATEQIGVTVEPDGGSSRPTTAAIMLVDLP